MSVAPTDGRVVLALMGPTAAGKTDIAIQIAAALPIDIVSVDSAMIYRGMDIGTAKPNADVLARHPHALVDILDPAQRYSVADFVTAAKGAIAQSFGKGRVPLLVGGTMLYFKALKEGIADIPATPPSVREELAARSRRDGLEALHRELTAIDPVAAGRIHPNNPQRLLRALEVYVASGRPISHWWARQAEGGVSVALQCNLVELTVSPPRELLRRRIEERVETMIEAGLVDEVRALKSRGDLSAQLPSMRCVGYRQVWDYLEGEIDETEMRVRIVRATKDLAKRQRTWLKRFGEHRQFDSAQPNVESQILQYLESLAILARKS